MLGCYSKKAGECHLGDSINRKLSSLVVDGETEGGGAALTVFSSMDSGEGD